VDDCPIGAISPHPSETSILGKLSYATDRNICDNCGICAETCYNGARELIGREMTVPQVLLEIERDVPFFDQSQGGVTFSGGEPMLQRRFLVDMLRACRAHEIHTVVDTSGFATWDAMESVRGDVNLFLYDLKMMDNERHQQYTGVSNVLILDNLRRLSAAGADCLVRIPLIPGVNDGEENLRRTGEFLSGLAKVYPVELMGYHEIARGKYEALGMVYQLPDTKAPSVESMQRSAGVLKDCGISLRVE
jgi:pyruvate formate lyase activating enzyme